MTHSEFNPSATEEMRFLQVWLLPETQNTKPAYDTIDLSNEDKSGKLKLFLSRDGRNGSMTTQADASIYAATLEGGQEISTDLKAGRKGWVQVVNGSLNVNGIVLTKGDGLAIEGSGSLIFDQGRAAEILFFDLSQ
ncbi:pirin family protein [Roseovarius sp. D22-M7]|uniref:pirin family protein n=1 Tax=Roseovarius sp. D22-M7 TaxID=3127116 RepID=UPI00301003BC